jgi:hypothetical protein
LRGGVLLYAAQAIPPTGHVFSVIDAEIAEKGHLWTETSWQNQRRPSTGYLDSGRKMVFQSCLMSTTSQPRLGASLRASTSLPVLFVLAS